MKSFKPENRERVECIPGDNLSNWYLAMLLVKNMPAGTWMAIRERQVTPTISEVARLAGITIDDEPPLTVDDLIGVKSLAQISKKAEVYYFSGPRHPVLDQMRMSRHYLSLQDFLDEAKYIGLSEAEAERYFASLLEHAYLDESLDTFGDPYAYKGTDPSRNKYIKRFALRKRFAKQIAEGSYKARLFANSGYIQALVKGTLEGEARLPYLQLIAELEEEPLLVVESDDDACFKWKETYYDEDSNPIGNLSYRSQYTYIYWLTGALLDDIGVRCDHTQGITQSAFSIIANALCPYDKTHKDYLASGELCPCGVHYGKLDPATVKLAKDIAKLLSSQSFSHSPHAVEIDEDDPDLDNEITEIPKPVFDW